MSSPRHVPRVHGLRPSVHPELVSTLRKSIIGSGNDDRVFSNFVAGSVGFSGDFEECRDNLRFEDTDEDGLLDEAEAEAGEALTCEG